MRYTVSKLEKDIADKNEYMTEEGINIKYQIQHYGSGYVTLTRDYGDWKGYAVKSGTNRECKAAMDLDSAYIMIDRLRSKVDQLKSQVGSFYIAGCEEYLAHYGAHCPSCGEMSDVTGSRFEIDGENCWQEVMCDNCNSTWTDIYALIGYVDLEKKEEQDGRT